MIPLAIASAVLGAVCSAVGAQLQHSGVRSATAGSPLRLRSIGRLARNRSWLLGFATLFLCAVLQIVALTFAPVTVVAPIVVLALPIVTVLNARAGDGHLDRAAWAAVVLSSVAVATFVAISAGTATETVVRGGAVFDASRLVAGAVATLALVAVFTGGAVRCAAFGAGAGVAYGLVSVLVRDVGSAARAGGFDAVPLVSLFGLVLAFLVGSWLIQLGYASGPPDIVVGFQTVLNPMVATAIGMAVLGETAGTGGGALTVLVTCGAVAVVGVATLARHHPEATHRAAHRVRARSRQARH